MITVLMHMINRCYKHRFITKDFEKSVSIDVFGVAQRENCFGGMLGGLLEGMLGDLFRGVN